MKWVRVGTQWLKKIFGLNDVYLLILITYDARLP